MNLHLKTDLSLKYYTTMRIGGTTPWAFFPSDKDSVREIFSIIQTRLKIPFFALGRGSNVIIQDQNLHKAAVLTHYLQGIEMDGDLAIVQSGVPMSFLARTMLWKYHLSGLEFVYGLPGSLGGGVFMNARVFGEEIANFVEWVEVYDTQKEEFLKISKEECAYGYKESLFQKRPYFIFQVALRLKKVENMMDCWRTCQENHQMRIQKHQFKYPSSGSFFKNSRDLGKSTGALLDELSLKNLRIGGAKISEYHANFFVNPEGTATYQDMVELKALVDKKTREQGFILEPEVHFIS